LKPKVSAIITRYSTDPQSDLFLNSLAFADELILINCSVPELEITSPAPPVNLTLNCELKDEKQTVEKAIQLAENDWLIFLHFNEAITERLAREMRAVFRNSKGNTDFYTRKKGLYFMGKTIRFGGYTSRKQLLLKNRNSNNSKIAFLKNATLDYNYTTFDRYNQQLDKYSIDLAESLYHKNKRPNWYHFGIKPFGHFLYRYFIQMGFLDSKEGFILAYLHAFSTYKTYLFLWMKYRKIDF